MRFVPALLVSALLIALGFVLERGQSDPSDFAVSIDFKSLMRLRYDETQKGRPESVKAQLSLDGRQLRVKLRVLPHGEALTLPYVDVAVDERDDFEPRQLILVREDSVLGKEITIRSQFDVIKSGILSINGRTTTRYLLVTAPFYSFIARGLGPVARRLESGVALSPTSQSFSVFLRLLPEITGTFPAGVNGSWWFWDPKLREWKEFGVWPEGWEL